MIQFINDLSSLQGKVALVTRASSGIGQAMASDMAAAGASVDLVAQREDKLEEAIKRITARNGETAWGG